MTYFPLEDAEPDDQHPELHQFPDWGERGHPYARPMPWLANSAWDAATDPSLPEGTAEVNGHRIDWGNVELVVKEPAGLLVPQVLLNDMAGMNDLLGKVLRGETECRWPPEPKRHRCLACWLVSLLPGHDRCSHGYLESGCETCGEW